MKYIRTKSIVIFKHKNRFLFTVCTENVTDKIFYIPVGGGVGFGEQSGDAAKKEVMEELGQEIENLQLLDIMENIFTYNGIDEHEIVFVYKADMKDKNAYDSLSPNKNDKEELIKLTWATIQEIKNKQIDLYPFRLLDTLERL
jgi:ADP-ribose pyrophosphatase YjhB (NUDIX family)